MDFEQFKAIIRQAFNGDVDDSNFFEDDSVYAYQASNHGIYRYTIAKAEWVITPLSTRTTGYGRTLTEAAEDGVNRYSRNFDLEIKARLTNCN